MVGGKRWTVKLKLRIDLKWHWEALETSQFPSFLRYFSPKYPSYKIYKTNDEDSFSGASVVMPILAPKLLSPPVLSCISHRRVCHHYGSINSPRQQSLCSTVWLHSYVCFYQTPLPTSLSILAMDPNMVTASHRYCN